MIGYSPSWIRCLFTPRWTHAWSRLVFCATILFFILFLLRTYDEKLLLGDEGIAALGAWRISEGQVPGRDFFESIPPISFYINALGFLLLGPTVIAERGLALLYGLVLAAMVDRLLSAYSKDLWPRVFSLAVLAHAGVSLWPLPSHHWAVTLFQIGALLALLHGLKPAHTFAWGLLSGVLTAVGGWTLQVQGAALALLLVLVFFPFIGDRQVRKKLFAGWVCGGIGISMLGALYLLPRVSPTELWYEWVVFPVQRYHEIPGNQSRLFSGWGELVNMWSSGAYHSQFLYASALTCNQALLWLLPFLALFAIFLAYRQSWGTRPQIGLVAAGAGTCIIGCLHRWSLTNLAWAAPMPLVALSWALSKGLGSPPGFWKNFSRAFLALFLGSSMVFGFIYYRYASPERTWQVSGNAGSLRSRSHRDAIALQAVIDAVESRVPKGAPLFCNGYFSMVNFLTLRPNPTRFNQFNYPGMHTAKQAQEVMDTLRSQRDAFVLTRGKATGTDFDRFLLSEYEPEWGGFGFVLLRPRPRPSSAGGTETP